MADEAEVTIACLAIPSPGATFLRAKDVPVGWEIRSWEDSEEWRVHDPDDPTRRPSLVGYCVAEAIVECRPHKPTPAELVGKKVRLVHQSRTVEGWVLSVVEWDGQEWLAIGGTSSADRATWAPCLRLPAHVEVVE